MPDFWGVFLNPCIQICMIQNLRQLGTRVLQHSKFSLKGQRTQWACGLESHQAVVRISNVNLFSASLEPLGDKVKGLNSFVLEAIQNPKQKCWKSSQQFFLEMKWGCHLDTHSVWGVLPPTWH